MVLNKSRVLPYQFNRLHSCHTLHLDHWRYITTLQQQPMNRRHKIRNERVRHIEFTRLFLSFIFLYYINWACVHNWVNWMVKITKIGAKVRVLSPAHSKHANQMKHCGDSCPIKRWFSSSNDRLHMITSKINAKLWLQSSLKTTHDWRLDVRGFCFEHGEEFTICVEPIIFHEVITMWISPSDFNEEILWK